MTSNADPAMLADFLGFTLAGGTPPARSGTLGNGTGWTWLDTGVLRLEPADRRPTAEAAWPSIVVSCRIHGDETAPIELLSQLLADLHTAAVHGARACTLELGKVRPFGGNDLGSFARPLRALADLIAGAPLHADGRLPPVFRVIAQIEKHSRNFELFVDQDVPNFTPFSAGTLLARDGDYRYEVAHPVERIVFPNPAVKPGLRAGLMVVEIDANE